MRGRRWPGRILVPGIQADIMPILVGDQGLLKSTALAAIVPSPDFFAEINLSDKDADLARIMRGKLVVEIGELKGMRSRDIEHTKAFVTRRYEQWVPKYKEFTATYPRRAVLFGTTNEASSSRTRPAPGVSTRSVSAVPIDVASRATGCSSGPKRGSFRAGSRVRR